MEATAPIPRSMSNMSNSPAEAQTLTDDHSAAFAALTRAADAHLALLTAAAEQGKLLFFRPRDPKDRNRK
jgi:hypothetical protein